MMLVQRIEVHPTKYLREMPFIACFVNLYELVRGKSIIAR